MNLILWTRHRGHRHQVDLARAAVLVPAACAIVAVLGGVFAAGYSAAGATGAAVSRSDVQRWQSRIDEQQAEIRKAKRDARENLDALATRVGELKAEVKRLEALGERLTRMAGLEEGEFSFDQAPPRGGPQQASANAGGVRSAERFIANLDALAGRIENRSEQLSVLENLMLDRRVQEKTSPAGRPVESGWLSSGYGLRRDPFDGHRERHYGYDFAGDKGSEIVSVAAGVVTWASERYGYGKLVEINHGGGYKTRYGHLRSIEVSVGETVSGGELLGRMGSTGRSTGPHVHFEVLRNGEAVDPSRFVRASRD